MDKKSFNSDEDPDSQQAGSGLQGSAVSSVYKVLGEFTDPSGAGVLGINNASSGTPIGVEGAVPNATSGGYGLYTAHDAKVDGTAEVSTLDGPVTNQQALTSIPGNDLDIDEQGVLNYSGPTYQNTTLDASGATWDPVGTLPSSARIEFTVDTVNLSHGRARVTVDGNPVATLNRGDVLTRIVRPSSTFTVNTLDGWRYNKSFDLSSEDSFPSAVAFKGDGTRMFVSGSINGSIFTYDLSTAWDITTASLANSYDVSSEEDDPRGISFKPDGTKMYVVGVDRRRVFEYGLSTPWDVTSATLNTSYPIGAGAGGGLTFKDDGTKLYLVANVFAAPRVDIHSLDSPWDISTAALSDFVELLDTGERLTGITFNGDGSRLYLSALETENVYEFTLSTAWDVSTASLVVGFDVESEDSNPSDVSVKPDDTEMFVSGLPSSSVHSYDKGFGGVVHASSQRE